MTAAKVHVPRMVRTTDPDAQPLYRAERAALGTGGVTFGSIESCEQFVAEVTGSHYWRSRCGDVWPVTTLGKVASHQRSAFYLWGEHGDTITLPREWAWCPRVILHELAHCARQRLADADEEAHGMEYRREFLALVGYVLGPDHAHALALAFGAAGLALLLPIDLSPYDPFDALVVDRAANGAIVMGGAS